MTTDATWQTFLREDGRLVSSLADGLAHAESVTDTADALEVLTTVEMDARVMGVAEVADLAAAMRERIASLEPRDVEPGELEPLREAGRALAAAFTELARPDSSGAHLDSDRMRLAREALTTSRPSAPPVAPPPPPGGDDETRWVPTVDEDMIDPFLDECRERLDDLAQRLVELERTPDDDELVRAVFRDLHTLKGSSAFVGLRKMNRLAHAAEDLVALVRDRRRSADRTVVDALLASLDSLTAIVERASARKPIDVDVEPVVRALKAEPGAAPVPVPAVPRPAASRSATGPAAGSGRGQTLRIDFEKLDHLMNLVGELVLAKGRLGLGLGGLDSLRREIADQRRNALGARGLRSRRARTGSIRSQDLPTELGRIERAFDLLVQELDGAGQALDFVSGELRDRVMKLRMVPIGRTWSKYHRNVREISHQLGKQVRLELVGGDTELDKILVEQLDEPFLHLVRNAIDHGIERPDERAAAGKDPEGLLRLSAGYRGNQVVIRVEDDGKGIDAARIRQKAVDKGVVDEQEAAALDEAQSLELIFRAGFSTAGQVSDLSGRGVGMDVVRETIARLKGTVAVTSTPGSGSRFEIRLPLTLAIVQVLLVRCAGETYAIPLDLVERTVSAPPEAIRVAATSEVLYESGRDVPLVRLREVLGLPAAAGERPAEEPVVLVDVADQSYGILCDGFLGRQEIVIKSLGSLLERVPGAAGATLLGDRCVLILDVPSLVRFDAASPAGAFATPAAEAAPGAPSVLVAEDSEVIRESIRRVLSAAGYDVVIAHDGAEALKLAAERQFDLVSTDVVMPNMDGYELTRRLRRTPEYRDVPIVMVTSKAERIDRIRGFDAGVDAYLTKPTDAAELLRVISRHLPLPGDGTVGG